MDQTDSKNIYVIISPRRRLKSARGQRTSSAALKDVRIRGKRIGISDDVHKETREEHRKLMIRVRKMREEGKFAYIPNSVPRLIKYKDGPKSAPGPLKTLRPADL